MALFKKDSKAENVKGEQSPTNLSWVIRYPKVTEKSAMMTSNNQYTFLVATAANKIQIKQAIVETYKVTPIAINIVNTAPRKETVRGRVAHRKGFKKAIVTLKKGDTIAFD